MTTAPKRILITGASGCIGHYICDLLIQQTQHELFLLVRNPAKLMVNYGYRPGVTVISGDMKEIEQFADLLKTIQVAILAAAAWGDTQITFDINVTKTIRLMNLLDDTVCEQVIYFSTASILDRRNQPLKEAGTIGTDYIRSKYECFTRLKALTIAPKITTVFPTLVFGGDAQKPYSHLSGGLAEVLKWMPLIRFFRADASFHFIHALDIAQVVGYLVEHPSELGSELVLGNPKLTADQAVEQFCQFLNLRIYFRIPLYLWLANLVITVFRFQMEDWDRFSINYRHFIHQNPIHPALLGLPAACPTVVDMLKAADNLKPIPA